MVGSGTGSGKFDRIRIREKGPDPDPQQTHQGPKVLHLSLFRILTPLSNFQSELDFLFLINLDLQLLRPQNLTVYSETYS